MRELTAAEMDAYEQLQDSLFEHLYGSGSNAADLDDAALARLVLNGSDFDAREKLVWCCKRKFISGDGSVDDWFGCGDLFRPPYAIPRLIAALAHMHRHEDPAIALALIAVLHMFATKAPPAAGSDDELGEARLQSFIQKHEAELHPLYGLLMAEPVQDFVIASVLQTPAGQDIEQLRDGFDWPALLQDTGDKALFGPEKLRLLLDLLSREAQLGRILGLDEQSPNSAEDEQALYHTVLDAVGEHAEAEVKADNQNHDPALHVWMTWFDGLDLPPDATISTLARDRAQIDWLASLLPAATVLKDSTGTTAEDTLERLRRSMRVGEGRPDLTLLDGTTNPEIMDDAVITQIRSMMLCGNAVLCSGFPDDQVDDFAQKVWDRWQHLLDFRDLDEPSE